MDLQFENSASMQTNFKNGSLPGRRVRSNLKVSLSVDYSNPKLIKSVSKSNSINVDTHQTDPGCSIPPLHSEISNSLKPVSTNNGLINTSTIKNQQFNSVKANRRFLSDYRLPNLDIKPLRQKFVENKGIAVLPDKPKQVSKLRPYMLKLRDSYSITNNNNVETDKSKAKTSLNSIKSSLSAELYCNSVENISMKFKKMTPNSTKSFVENNQPEKETHAKHSLVDSGNFSRSMDCLTLATGNFSLDKSCKSTLPNDFNRGTQYEYLLNDNLAQIKHNIDLINSIKPNNSEISQQQFMSRVINSNSKLSQSHDNLFNKSHEKEQPEHVHSKQIASNEAVDIKNSPKISNKRNKSISEEVLLSEWYVKSHYDSADKNERCRNWLESLPNKFSNIHVLVANSTFDEKSSHDLS